ncbi:MAG TPA: chromosome partitioning protein ParB [Phycisphaerales bacterium]|nr:chromosome partitioning protein ParB [Phycisphaerales bacterium]
MAKQPKHIPPKPRLGRGLSSLISSSAALAADDPPVELAEAEPVAAPKTRDYAPAVSPAQPARPAGEPLEIPTGEICSNPYQPRREFREEDLADLAASIAQQGILQPLVVAANDGAQGDAAYVLIAGERRLRAAKRLGLERVPCVVRTATQRQMLEWALIENIQRSDLNPIERAKAYHEYMDRFQLTQAEAGERLGQPRTTVANYLRMLELSDDLQKMLVEGQLSFGHAKVLASLAGKSDVQLALARKVVRSALSVRQLEQLVARHLQPAAGQPARKGRNKPPYLLDLEDQLTQAVGTHVSIVAGRAKHSGKIVIEYYSLDDFDRIAGRLGLRTEG